MTAKIHHSSQLFKWVIVLETTLDDTLPLLVLTFKRQRLSITAMPTILLLPANAAMAANTAMPMFLTSCETEVYGNMAESELLCVRVSTLLRETNMQAF